jgi:hypothetical protein
MTFSGAKIAVFLSQEHLFEAEDTTFQKPGKIGLCTKADSVTYFDERYICRPIGLSNE